MPFIKAELLKDRLEVLQTVESYVGTFFSKKWVQKNVLNMTESEIDDMQGEINKEAGTDPEDGGVDFGPDNDGVNRYGGEDNGGQQ